MHSRTTSKTTDEIVIENRKLGQRAFAAFARGDFPAFTAMWSPDIVFHFAGKSMISGTFRGREAVLANVQRNFDLSKGTLNVENIEVLAGERYVSFYNRVRATREGRDLDTHEFVTIKVVEGKTAEWTLVPEDQYSWDAFWS